MAVVTATQVMAEIEQYHYDVSGPFGRLFMNRDRRKRGLPPLRPTP